MKWTQGLATAGVVAAVMAMAGAGAGCSKDDVAPTGATPAASSAAAASAPSAPSAPSAGAGAGAGGTGGSASPGASGSAGAGASAAASASGAKASPSASSGASAKGAPTCGDKPMPPCPLYAWMKANTSAAMSAQDFDALAKALDKVVSFAPAGYTNWASISRDGAAAARAQNLDGVKASCRGCHNQYKNKYKNEMRDRPI